MLTLQKSLTAPGFSLVELLFVISVIAIISAIAVPGFSNVRENRLNYAVAEVSNALRYARQESMRSGITHGVKKLSGTNSIAVFRIDASVDPHIEVFDVAHPVDPGQPYIVDLENDKHSKDTEVLAYFRIYKTATIQEAISFDSNGEPIDGLSGRIMKRKTGGFLLNNDVFGATVFLHSLTGKITTAPISSAINDPSIVF